MRLLPRLSFATWLKVFGVAFGVCVAAGLVGAAWVATYVIRVTEDLPGIEDLQRYEPPEMSRVHAGDGRLIAEYAQESRVFVPIETVPPVVIAAFLSAEDKNFYTHDGIDYMGTVRGLSRGLFNMLRGSGPLSSGSSITQQVAKNFLLSAEQTVERKVREWALAYRLEEAYSKDKILELYLNEIYLGRRAYGVAAAALLYFDKSLDELSLSEAAYLAALPKGPNNYHPIRDRAAAVGRRNWVLSRMVANGYIDAATYRAAGQDELLVADRLTGRDYEAADHFVEEVRRMVFSMYGENQLYRGGLSIRTTLDTGLQVAAQEALRSGLEAYDRRHGYRGPVANLAPGEDWAARLAEVERPAGMGGDWRVGVVRALGEGGAEIGFADGSRGVIPFDPPSTDDDAPAVKIEDTASAWARRVDESGRLGPAPGSSGDIFMVGDVVMVRPFSAGGDGAFALRQIPNVNGAIMAMDPHTGRVLAMVGGYDYRISQFNRATQARRQPGSSFKPFVYAAALDVTDRTGEHLYTPVSKVLDAAYVAPAGEEQGWYKPRNYGGSFESARWYGLSTLRLGIELSRNVMTVRLASDMGLDRVSEYGERFGIYDDLPEYLSNSLGATETSLWRMVAAYGMLVNGGKRIEPTILDRVQDRSGRTIFVHDTRACTGCMVEDLTNVVEPFVPDLREPVVDPITAFQVVWMLEGVVNRGTARRTIGAQFSADEHGALAGKTGTTNDYRDAWFVGFSPDLVAGVYVGFDTPRSLGEGESGGAVAAPIFARFMTEALKTQPAIPFRMPRGVRLVRVDGRSGELARPGDPYAIEEAFRPGTEPTRLGAVSGGFVQEDIAAFDRRRDVRIGGAAPRSETSPAPGLGGDLRDQPFAPAGSNSGVDGGFGASPGRVPPSGVATTPARTEPPDPTRTSRLLSSLRGVGEPSSASPAAPPVSNAPSQPRFGAPPPTETAALGERAFASPGPRASAGPSAPAPSVATAPGADGPPFELPDGWEWVGDDYSAVISSDGVFLFREDAEQTLGVSAATRQDAARPATDFEYGLR